MLIPGGQPGGGWALLELTDALQENQKMQMEQTASLLSGIKYLMEDLMKK